jgi:pyruvate dehydrogenase E1 component alpha subunit
VRRAEGYGFPGVSVDGNDVEAVFEAARVAAERARAGGGPTLIECHTMRMHGHGAHDDMSYVPPALFEQWKQRDPIDTYAAWLVAEQGFDAGEIEALRESVKAQVDEAARQALASPMPDPETALDGVFADRVEPLGDGAAPWSRWADGEAASGNGRPSDG